MLHKVIACIETECETVVYSKQFDKLFHFRCVNCELLRNSQSELIAIWGLGIGRKRNGQRERKVTKRLSLVRMQPLPDLPDATETVAHGGQTGLKVFVKKTH